MTPNHLFNETITVSRPVKTQDDSGHVIKTFASIGTVKARLQSEAGREPIQGGRKYSLPMYNIYCDYASDIKMDDTITYNSVEFKVTELEVYPNTYMELLVEKK